MFKSVKKQMILRDLRHVWNNSRPVELSIHKKDKTCEVKVYEKAMQVSHRYNNYFVKYVASGISMCNKGVMLLVDIEFN